MILFLISTACTAQEITVQYNRHGLPYLEFLGKPVLAYGPSPQNIFTYLPEGHGNNFDDWLLWAKKYKINHVRSYPPSMLVNAPAINLYETVNNNSNKVNLLKLNEKYFDELRRVCILLKENGFFVHLQLWQAVTWKKNWDKSYYNSKNNVNPDISKNAGPNQFMVLDNPILIEHQKIYINKILDTTADLGNVIYDLANEVGNGTGRDSQWVFEMIASIEAWGKKHAINVLLTINDEGGMRLSEADEIFLRSDLVVKDLGRWDEHIDTQQEFAKPTISVRNIDWNYKTKKRLYFFAENNLEVNLRPDYQIRGRKYWWRMFMARVQMAGAYADAYNNALDSLSFRIVNKLSIGLGLGSRLDGEYEASYRLNTLAEDNFTHFRHFIDRVGDYANMIASDSLVEGHAAPHNYTLFSEQEAVVYLESPNGEAGYHYPVTTVSINGLMLKDGIYQSYFYQPATGKETKVDFSVTNGVARLSIPAFDDDIALHIKRSDYVH